MAQRDRAAIDIQPLAVDCPQRLTAGKLLFRELTRRKSSFVGDHLRGDGMLACVEHMKARLQAVHVHPPNNGHQTLGRAGGTGRTLHHVVFAAARTSLVSLNKVIEALIRAGILRKQMLSGCEGPVQDIGCQIQHCAEGDKPIAIREVELIAADAKNAGSGAFDAQIVSARRPGVDGQSQVAVQRIACRNRAHQMPGRVVNSQVWHQQADARSFYLCREAGKPGEEAGRLNAIVIHVG